MDWIAIAVIVGAVAGAVVALGRLFPDDQVTHRLERTPRATLAELAEGRYARVVGRAIQLEQVLEAPISGRPCLGYRARILGVVDKELKTLVTEERSVPFFLDDGTGHALVDSMDTIVVVSDDGLPRSDWRTSKGFRERAFLSRHQATVGYHEYLRFEEGIIEVGETIAVVGTAMREPDPDATPAGPYRGEQPTRLRLVRSPKGPIMISDSREATR